MVHYMKKDYYEKNYENVRKLLSPSKLEILLKLYYAPKTSKQLDDQIFKSKSTIIHNLEDLRDEKIIEKHDKSYSLTSKGILLFKKIINIIKNMEFLNNYSDFFNQHDDIRLPEDLQNHLYLWENSQVLVSDEINYSIVMNEFNKLLTSSNYITMITPIYSDEHLAVILDTIEYNGGKYNLITNKTFTNFLDKSKFKDKFIQLEKNNQIKLTEYDLDSSLNCIITCTDYFASIIPFHSGVGDDSQMLVQMNEDKIKKLNSLIEYNKLNF